MTTRTNIAITDDSAENLRKQNPQRRRKSGNGAKEIKNTTIDRVSELVGIEDPDMMSSLM